MESESFRIAKPKFNIYKVTSIKDEPNYFIGLHFVWLFTFVILPLVGLALHEYGIIALDITLFAVFPVFGAATTAAAIRYYIKAKRIYRTGRAYIIKTDEYSQLGEESEESEYYLTDYCFLDGDKKISIPKSLLHYSPNDVCVIYSDICKSWYFLKNILGNVDELLDVDKAKEDAKISASRAEKINDRYNTGKNKNYTISKIAAKDNRVIHAFPGLIVCACFLIIFLTAVLLLNLVFKINADLLIAIDVVLGVMTVLSLFGLTVSLISLASLHKLLKGAEFFAAQIIKVTVEDFNKDYIRKRKTDVDTPMIEVVYKIKIDRKNKVRSSGFVYPNDTYHRLKTLNKFPLMYNKQKDCAVYFTAKHCTKLDNQ